MSAKILPLLTIFLLLTVVGILFMFNRQGAFVKTNVSNPTTQESVDRPVHVIGENQDIGSAPSCDEAALRCTQQCPTAEGEEQLLCFGECQAAYDFCVIDQPTP